jgi:hypothetical protein
MLCDILLRMNVTRKEDIFKLIKPTHIVYKNGSVVEVKSKNKIKECLLLNDVKIEDSWTICDIDKNEIECNKRLLNCNECIDNDDVLMITFTDGMFYIFSKNKVFKKCSNDCLLMPTPHRTYPPEETPHETYV